MAVASSEAMAFDFRTTMNLNQILNSTVHLLRENAPMILTSTAIAGVVSTTVLAVKATPSAMATIWDAESGGDKATPMDKVKLTWKTYLPTALSGAATIAAIVALHTTHHKRNAALIGLYALSERTFQEYRDSVEEVAEGKVVEKIKEKVAEKKLESPGEEASNLVIPENGEILCYDSFSGRYFKSDTETIKQAVNKINHTIINHMYASLNDLYIELGLDTIKLGEDVGWNSDKLIEIQLTAVLTDQGKPAVYLDFANRPELDYHRLS